MSTLPKKASGRPTLLTEQERIALAQLYYDLGWTARKIRTLPVYSVFRNNQAVRMMAMRQRRKEVAAASGSNAQPPCDETESVAPVLSDGARIPESATPSAEARPKEG